MVKPGQRFVSPKIYWSDLSMTHNVLFVISLQMKLSDGPAGLILSQRYRPDIYRWAACSYFRYETNYSFFLSQTWLSLIFFGNPIMSNQTRIKHNVPINGLYPHGLILSVYTSRNAIVSQVCVHIIDYLFTKFTTKSSGKRYREDTCVAK
jgi:hypothetical protein